MPRAGTTVDTVFPIPDSWLLTFAAPGTQTCSTAQCCTGSGTRPGSVA